MTTDDREVLSALVDRESVDADILARVLETPVNRQLLVDFVRLRTALRDETTDQDAPARPQATGRSLSHGLLRSAAAIALVGLGLAGGAWWAGEAIDSPAAPTPSRVVQLTPVDSPR